MQRIFFLFLFSPLMLLSQHWKLAYPGQELSYRDLLNASNTTWNAENPFLVYTCLYEFESETPQQDSTFKLYEGDNTFKVPSIFEEYIRLSNGNQKIKINDELFTLPASYNIGHSWVGFESDQNYSVSCDSKTLQSFLGVVDSVYSFSVPNGTTIKLSKNYGLIEWTNSTTQISLFLAEKIKPKHKLFDYRNTCFFNEGHVYAGYDNTFYGNGIGKYARIRIEVSDKQVFQDHIAYSLIVWEDYKTITACSNANPQPCPWFYERNTIEVKVYKNQIIDWDRYYSPSSVNHASIKDNDTTLCFGAFPKFDTPDPRYTFSFSKGFVSDYYASQFIDMRNFEVSCYYPTNQPESCSSEFDLMTDVEDAQKRNSVQVFYSDGLLRLSSSNQKLHQYKLVDVSGRVLISGEFNGHAEIPVELKSGLYRVAVQNEEAEFGNNVICLE